MAILGIANRKVLAWQISNTMDADFWVEALEESHRKFGPLNRGTDCSRKVFLLYPGATAISRFRRRWYFASSR
jgi:hypothetical protein